MATLLVVVEEIDRIGERGNALALTIRSKFFI